MSIVQFLKARIAEDATANEDRDDGWWSEALHDRQLAEIEAKRALIDIAPEIRGLSGSESGEAVIDEDGDEMLRIMARVYRNHPDFNEDWLYPALP